MTIDLGGPTQKKCKQCHMEYVPSNAADAKLHRTFHDARVGGLDVPRGLAGSARVVQKCARCRPGVRLGVTASRRESEADDVVVEIGRRDAQAARNAAARVLEVVEEELGAVRTGLEELWSQVSLEEGTADHVDTPRKVDRYKVYLYLQGHKCLGFCLVERIQRARPTLPCAPVDDSNLELGAERRPASMGVSRIWVTAEYRRAHVAQRLLDAARKSFVPGLELGKDRVAFSQPTSSGARLARSWFGCEDGWLVYSDGLRGAA